MALANNASSNDNNGAEQLWREYLDGLEAQPFPTLPSMSYKPQASETMAAFVEGLQWPEGDVATSTAIQAAWSVLAAQYTGLTEALFGLRASLSSTKQQIPESRSSTVPVRISLQQKETIADFLQRVQQQAKKITEAGELDLQRISQISTDGERACRFQTLLVLENEDSKANTANVPAGTSDNAYALTLECKPADSGVDCQITYDSEVLGGEQARSVIHQFEHVLRQVCAPENAAKPLAEVEFISERDLESIWTWNATVPETVEACVHDLITETARRQPSSPALCAWDGEMSYEELDLLSTRLAHHLVSLGVNQKVIVPLCFEKSMWQPVAAVAVMKAGGASVAMDSKQPEERLRTIIEQTEPIVILCSAAKAELASRLSEHVAVVVVDKPSLSGLDDPAAKNLQLPTVSPHDRLYMNFTSGSTGQPKGAVITHSNIASAVRHQKSLLRFEPTCRVYDFVSYAFDVSWGNSLHTLTSGACLCIPSEEDRQTRIAESMQSMRVNYANLTPTVARLLDPTALPELKTVVLAGEALTRSDRAQWTPHVTLINAYGPAECSVFSTSEEMIQGAKAGPRIGKGMGLNAWVVSTNGSDSLVPVGGVGELVLEGPLVGAGYLADPVKTAAVFIEDPSWLLLGGFDQPGRKGRLYKTGDLVRCDADGGLTYMGRKDTQVKIRGQRVELGDIEHHIGQNLNNAKAQIVADVITPRESDRPILLAFLEFENENGNEGDSQTWIQTAMSGITERLNQVLPVHMIPTSYVPVAKMPMTATGKTDRRRLREMGSSMTLGELVAINPIREKRRAPETPTEQSLQALWASTLGIDAATIGLDDSFLQIGGDSIAAMRLVKVAREQGLPLMVADVLRQPRLGELAAIVATKLEATDEKSAENDSSAGSGKSLAFLSTDVLSQLNDIGVQLPVVLPVTNFQHFCIEGALRTPKSWWDYRYLDFSQGTDIARLLAVCSGLWRQYDILRTIFISSQGKYLQYVPPASEPPVEIQEIEGELEEEYRRMCEADDAAPVALGSCFTRFFITKPAQGPVRLTLRLSHAQYDGLSAQTVMQTMRAAFEGEQLPLAPQFTDFLRQNMNTGAAAFQHWRSLLKDSTMTKVPSSLSENDPRACVAWKTVTSIPTSAVGDTPATIFTAACAVTLAKVAKLSDVVLGRVVSGRFALDQEMQQVVGPCAGFIPVRVTFNDGVPNMKEAQATVQAQYVEGISHETIGLGSDASDFSNEELDLTKFGFTLQYQNMDAAPTEQFGSDTCRLEAFQKRDVRVGTFDNRVEVLARPNGDKLEIRMISRNHSRPDLVALLEEICSVMKGSV